MVLNGVGGSIPLCSVRMKMFHSIWRYGVTVSQQIANLPCLTAIRVRLPVSPLCDCIPPVEEVTEFGVAEIGSQIIIVKEWCRREVGVRTSHRNSRNPTAPRNY